MDFRTLLVEASQKTEVILDELKNISQTELLILGIIFLAIFGFVFIFLFLIKGLRKEVKEEYDVMKDPLYAPIVTKFDNLEKLLKAVQQDRIQYQNKVTTQLHELRDKVIRIQGIIGYEDYQINNAATTRILDPNSNQKTDDDLTKPAKLVDNRDTQVFDSSEVKNTEEFSSQTSEIYRDELKVDIDTESPDELKKKPENLSKGLSKTRIGFFGRLKQILSGRPKIADSDLGELEALLVGADLGVKVSSQFLDRLKAEVADSEINTADFVTRLKTYILDVLAQEKITPLNPNKRADGPSVFICVGVNGVGKTTSVAKLAARYKAEGLKVLLVAADTFRAAAVQQLQDWSKRVGVDIVAGAENAKPASVVFDGIEKARTENYDLVLIDTAGRLHNKANLMQELEGIKNVIKKQQESAPHEVLLVVDGATGQNALSQAQEFKEVINLTGLIVTKLDGTPKGGIVIAIKQECGIPVRFIGVGEQVGDLRDFNADEFVSAIFDEDRSDLSDIEANEEEVPAQRRRRRD
jgi:fused signal recognition particle receptor